MKTETGIRGNLSKGVILIFILLQNSLLYSQQIFIRLNQVGFLPGERKSAAVLSNIQISNDFYTICNDYTNQEIYKNKIGPSMGRYGNFPYCYLLDFSQVHIPGKFYIELNGEKSYRFLINNYIYNNVVDSLLTFFKIQRCGFNSSLLHDFCHYYDATDLILDGKRLGENKDMTGGWHDAGDYIKFLNTTAYAAYTLLFSYDFNNNKFGFDINSNNFPDILEEAKIGIDWLMKADYKNSMFVSQVQDLRDHDQGWRLPENDNLTKDRPGFLGIGKNLIGIYAAAMSLGYRVFSRFEGYEKFADSCLTLSKIFYNLRNKVPDLDISPTGNYQDTKFSGKLALGAVELYLSTNESEYLTEAKIYAKKAGSDFWWSWGNINSYADYRLAKIDSSYKRYILNNLLYFSGYSKKNIFSEAVSDTWGTNSAILGVSLQSILWQDLTGDTAFSKLSSDQIDYILGKNPWGISFIYDIGTQTAKNFHSQVAYFNHGRLTGAVAAGPISKKKIGQYNIEYANTDDEYEAFQTENAFYRDDRMDYITNEPTITANATAVFVFGCYSGR
jgi:hypothetical protein